MTIAKKIFGIIVFTILPFFSAGCYDTPRNDLILFDFESDTELDQLYWECHTLMSLSDQHATHGTKSLKLELYPSPYPGFKHALKQQDWEKYRALRFDIYNPAGGDVPITLRIDDKKNSDEYTDRYNKTFLLKPGMNQMVIPLDSLIASGTDRRLNLENIQRLLIFSVNPTDKIVLHLDHIRLAG